MKFSANTGFLWTDRPFLERIEAAAAAGFDAVEFHDEAQREDLADIQAVLQRTGLRVMGLNVDMAGTQGCAAIPGQEPKAEADFRAALAVADAVDAKAIHVLSGRTDDSAAEVTLVANLTRFAAKTNRTILIEPLCRAAAPGYALWDIEQAARVLDRVDADNAKIMFDVFHVAQEGHDLVAAWRACKGRAGHVQIAHPETRHEPGPELKPVLEAMALSGWDSPIGAEYRPATATAVGLAWRGELSE